MDTNESIKDYLETQINDLKKVIDENLGDLHKFNLEHKETNERIAKIEKELAMFKMMFPLYKKAEFRETRLYSDMNELEEASSHLKTINATRSNTIDVQKKTIDLLIKKLVDLNVNLSWITRD